MVRIDFHNLLQLIKSSPDRQTGGKKWSEALSLIQHIQNYEFVKPEAAEARYWKNFAANQDKQRRVSVPVHIWEEKWSSLEGFIRFIDHVCMVEPGNFADEMKFYVNGEERTVEEVEMEELEKLWEKEEDESDAEESVVEIDPDVRACLESVLEKVISQAAAPQPLDQSKQDGKPAAPARTTRKAYQTEHAAAMQNENANRFRRIFTNMFPPQNWVVEDEKVEEKRIIGAQHPTAKKSDKEPKIEKLSKSNFIAPLIHSINSSFQRFLQDVLFQFARCYDRKWPISAIRVFIRAYDAYFKTVNNFFELDPEYESELIGDGYCEVMFNWGGVVILSAELRYHISGHKPNYEEERFLTRWIEYYANATKLDTVRVEMGGFDTEFFFEAMEKFGRKQVSPTAIRVLCLKLLVKSKACVSGDRIDLEAWEERIMFQECCLFLERYKKIFGSDSLLLPNAADEPKRISKSMLTKSVIEPKQSDSKKNLLELSQKENKSEFIETFLSSILPPNDDFEVVRIQREDLWKLSKTDVLGKSLELWKRLILALISGENDESLNPVLGLACKVISAYGSKYKTELFIDRNEENLKMYAQWKDFTFDVAQKLVVPCIWNLDLPDTLKDLDLLKLIVRSCAFAMAFLLGEEKRSRSTCPIPNASILQILSLSLKRYEKCVPSSTDPDDDAYRPLYFQLLLEMHDFLGLKHWCSGLGQGDFLAYAMEEVMECEQSAKEDSVLKAYANVELDQGFWCLYSFKRERRLKPENHGVQDQAITIPRACSIYRRFRPEDIPSPDETVVVINAQQAAVFQQILDKTLTPEAFKKYMLPDDFIEKVITGEMKLEQAQEEQESRLPAMHNVSILYNQEQMDSWHRSEAVGNIVFVLGKSF